jgi:diguanylate cyclase (GGDEF)-like protein
MFVIFHNTFFKSYLHLLPDFSPCHQVIVLKTEKIQILLIWITLSMAAGVLGVSVYQFPFEKMGVNLIFLVLATITFSTFSQIQLPRIKIHITVSDILIFVALLTYGGEIATILAMTDSLITSLTFRRRGINIKVRTMFLNVGIAGIATFLTAVSAGYLFGPITQLARTDKLAELSLLLLFLAFSQFLVNSLFITVFSVGKSEKSFWKIWYEYCLNGLVIFIACAIIAGVVVKGLYNIDPLLILVSLAGAVTVYFTYRRYTDDVKDTAAKAEQAERERAEQAEKHIEELQLHIAQQEITEKALRESREKFRHAAYHDSLTDLPNRNRLTKHLQFLLSRAKETGGFNFAVLFLDLNRFKMINDSLGHFTGDSVILGVAMRLSSLMRKEDMVARLNGDEFAIILNGVMSIDDIIHFAELVRRKLALPFTLDERQIFTSVSIGIAIGDDSYENAADLLRDADIAMYKAKKSDKHYSIFDKKMHTKAVKLLEVETDLRYAIQENELTAFYQPIIDLQAMKLIGFEALMRWNHPTRGLIAPGEFIPVSESTGLIVPMTLWILRNSCETLAKWKKLSPDNQSLMMSVNLSGKHFAQDDLVAQIKTILKETDIHPGRLKLEITESAVMENAEAAISILNQLKRVGIQLSIDDFGTGYSSLSYLHRFPIDTLKIDRSFVSSMENGSENGEIVRTVIALAKALNLNIIAEGIETIHQLHQLRILGCQYGQGFLFSRPVPAEEARALLEDKGRWNSIMPNRNTPLLKEPPGRSAISPKPVHRIGDV